MGIRGAFGYIIGKKKRLMSVQSDADLLWQICVREIYVIMKHYGSIDVLRSAFENLKPAKNKPSQQTIENCKYFSDLNFEYKKITNWSCLLRYCQHSFINCLQSGYFLNDGEEFGQILILDFNKNIVRYYEKEYNGKIEELEVSTFDEIMTYEDMPQKTLTEIITETKNHYETYYENLKKIKDEQEKIQSIINRARQLGSDQNIISQATKLMDDTKWEEKILYKKYRVFYHRLDALDLIDHDSK
jgi:hypothetical protein